MKKKKTKLSLRTLTNQNFYKDAQAAILGAKESDDGENEEELSASILEGEEDTENNTT